MIKIDRHNYEEFFILYVDNELSQEDRRQVDLFVQENPDLKSDLDILMQSILVPDEAVIFDGKEDLLKQDDQVSISMNNYEEWLLLYTDNELDAAQREKVEQFASMHPAVKEEMAIFQKTRLQPEGDVIFVNKESLYRKEEEVRVIPFAWKRIAAAAAILLAIGVTTVLVYNKKSTPDAGIAATTKKVVPAVAVPAPAGNVPIKDIVPVEKTQAADPVLADNSGDVNRKATHDNNNTRENKKDLIQQHKTIVPVRENEVNQESLVKEEKKQDNNLPRPAYNPNMKAVDASADVLASNKPSIDRALTNQKEINPTMGVTQDNPQPLYTSNASPVSNDDEVMDQPGKKNKLRGFFRKITRTFEKNTNIKATDEDDRLLLGGLAIRL